MLRSKTCWGNKQKNLGKMKKILLWTLAALVILLIVIQFFQPEKNFRQTTTDSIAFQMKMPETVKKYITNSCFDCHSNQTRYPWYGRIAPVSWLLENHIREGKDHLNFSEWGNYSKRQQISLLGDICETVSDRSMPLKSYTLLHKDAELFDYEIEEICDWTERAAENLLNN
jgi:hypothetical protein